MSWRCSRNDCLLRCYRGNTGQQCQSPPLCNLLTVAPSVVAVAVDTVYSSVKPVKYLTTVMNMQQTAIRYRSSVLSSCNMPHFLFQAREDSHCCGYRLQIEQALHGQNLQVHQIMLSCWYYKSVMKMPHALVCDDQATRLAA